MNARALAVGLVLAGGIFWWANANAITYYPDGSAEIPVGDDSDPSVDYGGDAGPGDDEDVPNIDASDPDWITQAFLYMLRSCEHTAADVLSGDCYQTFYGGSRFSDMSNHPVLTGEKVGVPLPPQTCIAAGIASGNCVSTAAGAYQITVPTWKGVNAGLPDFDIASQDQAAVRLLQKCGALPALLSGDFPGAVAKAAKLWASLPGSTAQQGGRSFDFATAKYNYAVGGYA